MPFAREAIEGSATRRVARTHSLPKYEEGYEEWRNAFLNGHAGIYTISIKDAVSVAEKTWRIGMGCGKSSQERLSEDSGSDGGLARNYGTSGAWEVLTSPGQ
jgi:hypothetical protein